MHIFLFVEYAIGASDVTASYELQTNPEGQEGSQEVKVYLLCYIYCCIKYRSCDETFAAFYSILVQITHHTLVIELGSSSSLAMLNR